jgi:dihydroorotase
MAKHPVVRSAKACFKSSSLAVELARVHNTRLHLLHLTTAKELSLLSNGALDDKQITAEACVHHLYFDDGAYGAKGTFIKCNPAIKTSEDRKALLGAVVSNKIDIIATDHAPHTREEKMQSYFKAPSGLPLVQQALVCLLEHYHDQRFTLPLIVEKIAHAPARLFRIKDRGYIREGYWADLVLVDLNRRHVADETSLFYQCAWSPFTGRTFRSSVHTTIVSGSLAFYSAKLNPKPAGQRLEFAPMV